MKWIIATVTVLMLAGCGSGVEWFPENSGGESAPTFSANFTDLTDKVINTQYQSNQVTVTGTNAVGWTVSVSGGLSPMFSINNGTYTNTPTTILPNQSLTLQQQSSPNASTISTMTLTVGTATRSWSVTTAAPTQ